MVYKPVGADENGKFPPRVETALGAAYAAVKSVNASYGNGSTEASTHMQNVITAANTAGVGVYVPAGEYKVSVPLENVRRMRLAEGAKITAGTPGMAAVIRTQESTRMDGGYIVGKGVINPGTNATIGVHVRNFLHFVIDGLEVNGGNAAAIKLGSVSAAGRAAEAILSNLRLINNNTIVAGSRAILVENSGDHSYSQIIVQNYEGIFRNAPGCNGEWTDVHGWADPAKGNMKVGWEEYANSNTYVACHADTPTEYGWRVYGYGNVWVGSKSYLNPAVPQLLDNTVVGIKFETTNSIATVMGHGFTGGGTGPTLRRMKYDIETVDGNYDLIRFVPGTSNNVANSPIQALYDRVLGLNSRDRVRSQKGLEVDSPTPVAGAGLTIKTGGVNRWKIVTDGLAESGGNTGTGLVIQRCGDDGAVIGDPIYISRTTGTIVVRGAVLFSDGANLVTGSVTGTQFGTSPAQKLGFYGNAPVAKPAALTAADATAVTAVYGADVAAVINNLRTRINQLEARQQLVGLLS